MMKFKLAPLASLIVFAAGAIAQTADPLPIFELADVHASTARPNNGVRGPLIRTSGRYEFANATMLDLIRTAYNVDADKVLGGPNWLESDRFDVLAKVPPKTSLDTARLMLQGLLADRFKLVLHKDAHALPTYALSVGKGGHKLKEADGSGEPGCAMTIQQGNGLTEAALQGAIQNGGTITLRVATLLYSCHSITMTEFAAQMRSMTIAASYVGNNPVADQTGLQGKWDFDFKYTPKPPANRNQTQTLTTANGTAQITQTGDYITLFEAMDKQLGLKLDPANLPIPVILVDSANRQPTPNSPEVTAKMPPPPSGEFDVAELRLSPPGATNTGSRGFQPNGQIDLRAYPLRSLISLAWDLPGPDLLADTPKWMETAKIDLIAKIAPTGPPARGVDIDSIRPALRALLEDSFKVKIHTEMRPGQAWVLTAGKPKMVKADPINRSVCKTATAQNAANARESGTVPGVTLTCQNVTMKEFAEQLSLRAGGYFRNGDPVIDETGLTGSYDFSVTYSAAQYVPGTAISNALANAGAAVLRSPAGDGANPNDPSGAISLYDAVSKQLGLKLEAQKRPVRTYILDHIDDKPAE